MAWFEGFSVKPVHLEWSYSKEDVCGGFWLSQITMAAFFATYRYICTNITFNDNVTSDNMLTSHLS